MSVPCTIFPNKNIKKIRKTFVIKMAEICTTDFHNSANEIQRREIIFRIIMSTFHLSVKFKICF